MIVLDVVSALALVAMLGALIGEDTRDTRIRITTASFDQSGR